jgi:hypothetical protein
MLKLIQKCSLTILILGSTFNSYGVEHGPYGRYTGPHSLGTYTLNHYVSLKSLLIALGGEPAGMDFYCFQDKERGTFLYVTKSERGRGVDGVTLSTFPNCEGLPVKASQIDPAHWSTPEGIGLGSTTDDVLHAYGKPVFAYKLTGRATWGIIANPSDHSQRYFSVGDTGYLYSCLINEKQGCSDDLRTTRIGFDKGKVIWIQISNSE